MLQTWGVTADPITVASPGKVLTKKAHLQENKQTNARQLERTVMLGLAFLHRSPFPPSNTAAKAYFKSGFKPSDGLRKTEELL